MAEIYGEICREDMAKETLQMLPKYIITCGVVTCGTIAFVILRRHWQRRLGSQPPKEWTLVGTLEELHVFPIKSCGKLRLSEAECWETGLKCGVLKDRNLVVVDEKSNFISARKYPKLLLVTPQLMGSVLRLLAPDMETLEIDIESIEGQLATATVWGVESAVVDCGDMAASWFSRFLLGAPTGFRLVNFENKKDSLKNANFKRYLSNLSTVYDTGTFMDEASYHLVNLTSVVEFNNRKGGIAFPAINFRPNFLINGPGPFEEDKWRWIKIGETVFEYLIPCARCLLTTFDPLTAEKNENNEPLNTLKTFRNIDDPDLRKRAGNGPTMGILIGLRSKPGSTIRVNDSVYLG